MLMISHQMQNRACIKVNPQLFHSSGLISPFRSSSPKHFCNMANVLRVPQNSLTALHHPKTFQWWSRNWCLASPFSSAQCWWFTGHGGIQSKAGLDDFVGPFQPYWSHNSMNLFPLHSHRVLGMSPLVPPASPCWAQAPQGTVINHFLTLLLLLL